MCCLAVHHSQMWRPSCHQSMEPKETTFLTIRQPVSEKRWIVALTYTVWERQASQWGSTEASQKRPLMWRQLSKSSPWSFALFRYPKEGCEDVCCETCPQSSTTCMPIFKAYLAEQLGVHGVSEVGYYLRGSKRLWLSFFVMTWLCVLEDKVPQVRLHSGCDERPWRRTKSCLGTQCQNWKENWMSYCCSWHGKGWSQPPCTTDCAAQRERFCFCMDCQDTQARDPSSANCIFPEFPDIRMVTQTPGIHPFAVGQQIKLTYTELIQFCFFYCRSDPQQRDAIGIIWYSVSLYESPCWPCSIASERLKADSSLSEQTALSADQVVKLLQFCLDVTFNTGESSSSRYSAQPWAPQCWCKWPTWSWKV